MLVCLLLPWGAACIILYQTVNNKDGKNAKNVENLKLKLQFQFPNLFFGVKMGNNGMHLKVLGVFAWSLNIRR